MSFDKFVNKAKNLANDPKVREKLKSEKAEKTSDSILDKAAGVAESLTNGKHSEKINKARDAADRAIGTDGQSEDNASENERSEGDASGNEERGDNASEGERPEGNASGHERREGDNGPRS